MHKNLECCVCMETINDTRQYCVCGKVKHPLWLSN